MMFEVGEENSKIFNLYIPNFQDRMIINWYINWYTSEAERATLVIVSSLVPGKSHQGMWRSGCM